MARITRAAVLVGALMLTASGCTLYGWGDNNFGALGDGTSKNRLDPVPAARNPDWVKVDAGFYHACGIDVARALYCWGNNTRGELGLGTIGFSGQNVPKRVGGATDWTDVSGGGASGGQGFTCGIRGGSLFCWGFNDLGQLGVGDTTERHIPTQVGTASDWRQVSAGSNHACAIRTSGALFCWGNNGAGGLGDGTNDERQTPVRVGTATDWKLVSAGAGHTCGIRATGTLFCWGNNFTGAVGDGTIENRNTPTAVGTSTGWTKVSAGFGHTCAIRNAALFCWGYNGDGELGNGTFSDDPNDPRHGGIPDPTQVGTGTDWTDVGAGNSASCAIRASNLLFCWGGGPAGDGTSTVSAVPKRAQFDKWVSVSLGGYYKLGLRNLGD